MLTTSLQVDGSVFAIYNVGLTDHVVNDPFVKVNDGAYHVIRFTRNGANATLQIDDLPQQVKIPTGKFRGTTAELKVRVEYLTIGILRASECELKVSSKVSACVPFQRAFNSNKLSTRLHAASTTYMHSSCVFEI
jgi:hypothetical protein